MRLSPHSLKRLRNWFFPFLTCAMSPLLPTSVEGDTVGLEIVTSSAAPEICGEVEVAFRVQNPDGAGIAGYQAFLRYPAEIFEPLRYEEKDLRGFALANGPEPFGTGFSGCTSVPSDPWDDRSGMDAVSVVASAYGPSGDSGPVESKVAVLGAFIFRVRSNVASVPDHAHFRLEFEPCNDLFPLMNGVFDGMGNSFELTYLAPDVEVRVAGIRVLDLSCSVSGDGDGVSISWALPPGGDIEGVNLYRGSELIRQLIPPSIQTFIDSEVTQGSLTYTAAVVSRGKENCGTMCEVQFVTFLRGDPNSDGKLNISDPVLLLNYLYQDGSLSCQDAADVNDDGELDLSDVISILGFLFQSGAPPSPPYPEPGADPTPDSLTCGVQ